MEIDWPSVKKRTLWHYDDLIKKLLDVIVYGFVQELYNHTMTEAVTFAQRIRGGYLENRAETVFIDEIIVYLHELDGVGIMNYRDLVQKVNTKAACEQFIRSTRFEFEALIQVLGYLFRWVLPFKCPVKELLDTIDSLDNTYIDILKAQGIRSNLDVLENYRTKASRVTFSMKTGVSETFLLALVHRADISRLAYVRGKTIKHLCGGGYDTLEKIANADVKNMEADMTAYYATIGKSFADFKAVIPLDWMVGGARILPKLVEE